MPDVYASVTDLDPVTQQLLIGVLETRAADPRQQAMRRAFLSEVAFPAQARVLEVGCGTGALTRVLSRWPGVREVVGVDPAPAFLARARELSADMPNVTYQEADGRSLPFEPGTFDVTVFDSVLSHVPGSERALEEAFRVLRPGGILAVFDGDYATTTVAIAECDPLQTCVDATMANSVTDRRVMRRVSTVARSHGFEGVRLDSHGFSETGEGGYMLTVVSRGADILAASGVIGVETAQALKAEAGRRVEAGTFFGHIAYASLIARKPS
jgi:ubiquinone/menaquinone biosynthesis C-methylase UbiE